MSTSLPSTSRQCAGSPAAGTCPGKGGVIALAGFEPLAFGLFATSVHALGLGLRAVMAAVLHALALALSVFGSAVLADEEAAARFVLAWDTGARLARTCSFAAALGGVSATRAGAQRSPSRGSALRPNQASSSAMSTIISRSLRRRLSGRSRQRARLTVFPFGLGNLCAGRANANEVGCEVSHL